MKAPYIAALNHLDQTSQFRVYVVALAAPQRRAA